MERINKTKIRFYLYGIAPLLFIIFLIFFSAGFFKNFNFIANPSLVSYITENMHTGLANSYGAQVAFNDKNEATEQYTIVVPKKIESQQIGAAKNQSVAMGEIPNQLFDINLELDSVSINKIDELNPRVMFTSFGKIPTPVDMTFDILNGNSQILYSKTENIIVETERVYSKDFTGLILPDGKYTIRLTTLYNGNVKDEFRQAFEVKGTAVANAGLAMAIWIISIFIVAGTGGFIIFRFIKRKKNK